MASTTSPSDRSLDSSLSRLGIDPPDLPKRSPYSLERGQPSPRWPSLLRPPIAVTKGVGILTNFPSTTAFALALGADSPCADYRCAGTLGLPAGRFFTSLVVTHVSIRTSDTSREPLDSPSQAYGTLRYRVYVNVHTRSFGYWFSPVKSSAQADSTSELLRFL